MGVDCVCNHSVSDIVKVLHNVYNVTKLRIICIPPPRGSPMSQDVWLIHTISVTKIGKSWCLPRTLASHFPSHCEDEVNSLAYMALLQLMLKRRSSPSMYGSECHHTDSPGYNQSTISSTFWLPPYRRIAP